MNCEVCGCLRDDGRTQCVRCRAAVVGVDPSRVVVVVDGSCVLRERAPGIGGAGLVVVTGLRGELVASVSCSFRCGSGFAAEVEAIVRGSRWVRGAVVFSDSLGAIGRVAELGVDARFIPKKWRAPHHNLAHRMSVVGRRGAADGRHRRIRDQ